MREELATESSQLINQLPQTEAEIIEHWSKIGYLQGLAKAETRIHAEIEELTLQLEEALKPDNQQSNEPADNPT